MNCLVSVCVNTYSHICCFFFFFNDTATTEIYTLSLHDALPIYTASKKFCPVAAELCVWEIVRVVYSIVLAGDADTKIGRAHV